MKQTPSLYLGGKGSITYTLESLCNDVRTGRVSPYDLRAQALSAEASQINLNCFIREQDAETQFRTANTDHKGAPLWGIPVSFKDNICVKGLPVTAGTPGMAGCIADCDADIVSKLTALGAVVSGKNNMHELSFGITSVNHQWGTVGNPAAPGYCAGGSSGGGAAAIAAGIVPVAIGTDTGGSVRIPAAFCGISGFRPTTGRWSSVGIIPVSHSKDAPGLLTRTAQDAAFLYDLLSGDRNSSAAETGCQCRIGLPVSLWSGLHSHVMHHCRNAVNRLEEAGFECVRVDDTALAALNETLTYTVPLYEFFSDFPRALLSLGWENKLGAIFAEIGDDNVRHIIHTHLAKTLISPADYALAIENMRRLRLQIDALFSMQGVDMLAYPTVPCQVPLLSQTDRQALFTEVIRNTDLASNAALPSISLPVAPAGTLPVGLSLDAKRGEDRFLLSMAARIEALLKN